MAQPSTTQRFTTRKSKDRAPSASPAHRRRIAERLWANRLPLAICGLTLILYSRSLFCGFVRDDHAQIVQNPQVQSWEYLPQLLGSHLWSHQAAGGAQQLFYRPLFSLWMLLVDTVGGLEPWWWHLASVVLHVAATYLVFLLCLRLTASEAGAAVGASLFAVHPVHVDAVTWVSASNEVLFTVCLIGAFLFLLPREDARVRLWPSALAFCAGIFSKETAVALLPVLVAVAWVRLKSSSPDPARRWWRASAPYLAAIVFYFLARGLALAGVEAGKGEHSWRAVFFTSPSILLFYLRKLVVPLGLAPCYVNAILAQPTRTFWIEAVLLVLAGAAAAWMAVKYRSPIALTLIAAGLAILPALAVLRIYPEGDMTHDRYLYAPSVALSVLVAMLAAHAWSKAGRYRWVALGCAVPLIAGFAALTFAQQSYYQDDLAFYQRAIEVNPANALARSALGDVYLDRGLTAPALASHAKAHQLAPGNAQVTLFLARALFATKQYSEAEAVLQELLRDPGLATTHRVAALLSLAGVEITLQHLESAQAILEQAERLDPAAPQLHWTKGVWFQREGLLAQAQAEYEREYQISGDPEAKRQAAMLQKRRLWPAAAGGAAPTAPPGSTR